MKKIAFVNQRYGKEVNGGSEYYTMLMAQKLKEHYEIEVLTSKALTYDKWEDYYKDDVEDIDGITVRRFSVKRKRNRILQRLLKTAITRLGLNTAGMAKLWNKVLGPYIPGLVDFIKVHKDEYAAFIFVTYMYYPTVFGMPEVADKSIFVPTAHDEYCIYFKIYDKIFHMPRKIVYLTPEEKAFVQEKFHNQEVESEVIGIGVSVPEDVDAERFRCKYEIEDKYILYAGRVDEDKGCGEMFQMLQRYNRENEAEEPLKLIVIGKAYMKIPDDENITYLGFVSEQDKYDAIKGAKFVWLPSQFESLSIAVLEAMAIGVQVLVNGKCEVLKGHCERSGGGRSYRNYNEFYENLKKMNDIKLKKSNAIGVSYMNKYYQWEIIMIKWKEKIEKL